jgi:hypothetical protein
MTLHNLCFSIWYHNMLQRGKNQVQGVLEVDAFLVTRGTTHYSEEF